MLLIVLMNGIYSRFIVTKKGGLINPPFLLIRLFLAKQDTLSVSTCFNWINNQ